ncbi:tRNA (N6-isopentenyl adenosine(37)-C2)-methylthiotransferase MiaB [Paenibacillus sp. CMAA1364]
MKEFTLRIDKLKDVKPLSKDNQNSPDLKSGKGPKDYSQYFDFSDAKVLSEDEFGKRIRIRGREINILSEPNHRQEKQRGKEDVQVLYGNAVPDELLGIGKDKHYIIYTFGCQMNEHDTETMKGLLEQMGYTSTEDRQIADIILMNTCAIRENAEDKVFGELGHLMHLKTQKPELLLGVCGCMAQEENVVNRILQKHAFVDLIFGTHNIHRLPHLIKEALFSKELVVDVWSKEGDIIENLPKKREGMKAWVNIMYGCDKFCTYCIVPFTRGKERSRRPEDVIAEVRELARQGFKEVTLLGQNVNAYGKDFTDMTYSFANLMDDMHKIDIPRVRFTTSHPRDFDDALVHVLAKGGNLVEHIHLPVQSGSTEILKKMSRKYTRDRYMDLAHKIKEAIPSVGLTTDIIVGFPGETDEQFEETMTLVNEIGFDSAFTFIYSPREGTPAAIMEDNIPMEVKKERLQRLNQAIIDNSLLSNEKLQGKIVEVLVEGESKNNDEILAGRTRTNRLVHFEGGKDLIGTLVNVEISEVKTWYIKGKIIQESVAINL